MAKIEHLLVSLILFCNLSGSLAVDKYVRTPGGLVWSSCLHEVNHNAHLIVGEDYQVTVIEEEETRSIPKCPKPTIFNRPKSQEDLSSFLKSAPRDSPDDGWQVWTAFNNNDNATFNSFIGYFSVPEAPSNWYDEGIIYIFPGLQNDNWVPINGEWPTPPGFDIIQPVLQYGGGSENGGGDYWGVASWYVTLDSGAFWSTEIQVNAGDNIYGKMTRTNDTTWEISGVTPDGTPTTLSITKPDLISQSWAYVTLEVYNIDDCSLFPAGGSEFTKMVLTGSQNENVTPTWTSLDNNGDHCKTTIEVHAPDHVTITF